jgi:hypothetical protein
MAYALVAAQAQAQDPQRRAELDAALQVDRWPTPTSPRPTTPSSAGGGGGELVAATPGDPGRPPPWWGADEEAVSQATLAELGVEFTDGT